MEKCKTQVEQMNKTIKTWQHRARVEATTTITKQNYTREIKHNVQKENEENERKKRREGKKRTFNEQRNLIKVIKLAFKHTHTHFI